jgi:sugar phosphate permease
MPEPDRGKFDGNAKKASFKDYVGLLKNKSYTYNTLAMTALTFSIGGLSFWVPSYIFEYRHVPDLARINMIFGAITVVAGLIATLLGGIVGDKLRERFPGAYFLVAGVGMLAAFPFVIGFLLVPFPMAWGCLFMAIFFLFFNTGPSNTALANVTHPSVRAMAFGLNILVIHAAGDAISPPLIGFIADHSNLNTAFLVVSVAVLLASVLWLYGARHLQADTQAAEDAQKDPAAGTL